MAARGKLRAAARFNLVFVGLESPSADSLKETRKFQNTRCSLVERVQTIQRAGMVVMGGFILGFDSDPENIFELQARFIEETAVPDAYISVLVALPGTPLYARMAREGRLLQGEETKRTVLDSYTNIRFHRPLSEFLAGHQDLLRRVYEPRAYFERAFETLRRMSAGRSLRERAGIFMKGGRALLRAASVSGRPASSRAPAGGEKSLPGVWRDFFRQLSAPFSRAAVGFITKVACRLPEQWPWVIHFLAMGYHYHRFIFEDMIPDMERRQKELPPPVLKAAHFQNRARSALESRCTPLFPVV